VRKVNLKYLAHLQALPEADLRVLGRQTDLGEGFLVSLQSQLSAEPGLAQLGLEIWVKTFWDVILSTPECIESIAKHQPIDRHVLSRFHDKCQALVKKYRSSQFYADQGSPNYAGNHNSPR
jgi:hypothetical protein